MTLKKYNWKLLFEIELTNKNTVDLQIPVRHACKHRHTMIIIIIIDKIVNIL